MTRLRLTDQLRALQHRCEQLRQEARYLVRGRRELQLRHAILSAWCESFSFLQLSMALQPCQDVGAGQFELLLQKEVSLLQHLTESEGLLQLGGLAVLLHPDVETIAPYTDVMSYLHRTMSKPPAPEAATVTAEAVGAYIQTTVQDTSFKLHQLAAVPPWERSSKIQGIADVWDRFMHFAGSLVITGRQDILEHALSINLETLQHDPAAASHQHAQAAVVVPVLNLSLQQQEMITAGTRLFFDLQHNIHAERKQLQVQMDALETGETADRATDAPNRGSNSSSSTSSNSNSSSSAERLVDRQEQLEKQLSVANRLQLLLHKEYMLRMTAMGFIYGCLTYVQLARLAVMSWPYPMRVLFFAAEVTQRWERLVQQQLLLSDD